MQRGESPAASAATRTAAWTRDPFPAHSVDTASTARERQSSRRSRPSFPEAAVKKLKLDVDALAVESFDAESG
jgi:hypothetical protein